MSENKILTRENGLTEELKETVERVHKGILCVYDKYYYLDYDVNEYTGKINRKKKAKFCTKNQVERNLKAVKEAYLTELNKQTEE